MYNKKKAGEPEVKQPEKIKTALKATNEEDTYQPEILASSKRVNPNVARDKAERDIVEEDAF